MARILIVDDHEVVRRGLKSLLEIHGDFSVVGEASTQEEAVAKALELRPDVVIMDVKLSAEGSQEGGIAACAKIKEQLPDIKVVMLSSFADESSIYESIIANASGYLLKGLEGEELIHSIKMVLEGKSLLDPVVTEKVFRKMRSISEKERIFGELTNQEKEVLRLIAEGKANKEIAEILGIGEKTVRNYVSQILNKLGVSNRVEAASLVMKYKFFE